MLISPDYYAGAGVGVAPTVRLTLSRRPMLVLVVDDEILVLNLVADVLQDAGYAVTLASSDDEAFRELEAHPRDLRALVTDVNLGSGCRSGWEVAARARALIPGVAVVYVTGDSGHQWSANGVPNSFLIEKPFEPPDVLMALASAWPKN